MLKSQIFSRCTDAAVDFRPNADASSPAAQVRRLSVHLEASDNPPSPEDITDCPDAIRYLKEYSYRKVFTATTHEEYVALEQSDPVAIEWLLKIHEVETSHFVARKR